MRIILFISTLLLTTHSVSGQLMWQNVDAQFGSLPTGVHVYKTTDSVEGKPNIAFYAEIPLQNLQLQFTTDTSIGRRLTPQQYYQRNNNPLLVVNGTFFSFATNRNLNIVIQNGKVLDFDNPPVKVSKTDSLNYYYTTPSAIGINKNRMADVAWLYYRPGKRWPFAMLKGPSKSKGPDKTPSWREVKKGYKSFGRKKMKWKMETAIGGGPSLLRQGKITVAINEERKFVGGEKDRHPRTAMGYTSDGKLIVLCIEGRNTGVAEGATLHQQAVILQQLGCWEALNLDGGGSSCLLINGKQTITPSDKGQQRPVPAVFMVQQR